MTQRFSAVLLIAAPLAVLPLAASAEARPAQCSVTKAGKTDDGPCRFTPMTGGSFQIGYDVPGGSRAVWLTLKDGKATVSAADPGQAPLDWGAATRDAADRACWSGEDFRICARDARDSAAADSTPAAAPGIAIGEPAPGQSPLPTARTEQFVGRCHMDACTWIEQSGAREVGRGSDAVPGRVMEVTQRTAMREYPGGTYPEDIPADLVWEAPSQVRYFCSETRPALREQDGSWSVLPLPQVFGATEAATNAFIHVCAPDKVQPDPYAAAETLGYTAEASAGVGTEYPDFEALTTR